MYTYTSFTTISHSICNQLHQFTHNKRFVDTVVFIVHTEFVFNFLISEYVESRFNMYIFQDKRNGSNHQIPEHWKGERQSTYHNK